MRKKILFISMILVLIISFILSNNDTKAVNVDLFYEKEYYQKYIISCDLELNRLIDILNSINNLDYRLVDIKVNNNYQEKIKKEIDDIVVEEGSSLDFLDKYINKYILILDKYDLSSETALVMAKRINVREITLITNVNNINIIYDKIKKG